MYTHLVDPAVLAIIRYGDEPFDLSVAFFNGDIASWNQVLTHPLAYLSLAVS